MIGFFDSITKRMVGSVSADSPESELVTRNLPQGCVARSVSDFGEYFLKDDEPALMPPSPGVEFVFDAGTGEWAMDAPSCAFAAKKKRSQLLAASDWTQLPDVPLATKEAWATYRQALRDITEQPGYPLDVVWPVAPIL